MSDIDELIDDLVRSAQDVTSSYEWGTGMVSAEINLDNARLALRAAFTELQQRIAALEETKCAQLERIVEQVEKI